MTEATFPEQRQGPQDQPITGREEAVADTAARIGQAFGAPAPPDDAEFEPTIVRGRD